MQEHFLHYVWKFRKFDFGNAKTVNNSILSILEVGTPNFNSGPDFFNAQIKIEDQIWAGNVEIHIKSSDWYLHAHERDSNYDNVILHVVWEDDVAVYRKDNSVIPTLQLKDLVFEDTLENYRKLLLAPNDKWINCEADFDKFNDFDLRNFQESLFLERLYTKSDLILEHLKRSENNWEAVLFKLLAKNFGLNVNGSAFLSMANSLDFGVVQKIRHSHFDMEALLFGQSGLLDKKVEDPYYVALSKEYEYLKIKFNLENSLVERAKYFRLRPDNFPNIRLSQLAYLYSHSVHLFSELIETKNIDDIYNIFKVDTSTYWYSHYSFAKSHPEKRKMLSHDFIDLLIINTIIPLKFCFYKAIGKTEVDELLELMYQLNPEKNKISERFNKLRSKTVVNAMQSQAMLHLKNEYCDKNACLDCRLGNKLITGLIQ